MFENLSEEQLIAAVERLQQDTPEAFDIIEHLMIRIERLEKLISPSK